MESVVAASLLGLGKAWNCFFGVVVRGMASPGKVRKESWESASWKVVSGFRAKDKPQSQRPRALNHFPKAG
jgi:hypothetical protein